MRIPSRTRPALLILPILAGLLAAWPAGAPATAASLRFGDPAFAQAWTRTDGPVAGRQATRSWYWGPSPGMIMREPFAGLPGGSHLVQYFDKSRMEVNDPNGDRASKWFVTNGLLTVELISGRIQTGLTTYEDRGPAAIPLASDTDDPNAPTYASFRAVSNTPLGDHPMADHTGAQVTATIDVNGRVGQDPSRALDATRLAHYEPRTKHNIPGVFWTFLNASGPVNEGSLRTGPLSDPWNFATGLPISEAYWARVKIAGVQQWALIQAYERRALTYVPANPPEWRVQMGNIGQHYFQFRYGALPVALNETLNRMAAAPSYHFASLLTLKTASLVLPFARQAGDYQAPNRTHFVQQATDGTSEIITIGPTLYLKAGAGAWQKAPPSYNGALDLSSLIGVLQYARDIKALPDEVVNGVAARRLHMTLDPTVLPTITGLSYSAAEGDVWIAKTGGMMVRQQTTITLAPGAGQQGFLVATIDFSQFGEAVRIDAPIP
jgi:hypothetical protein